MIRVEDVAEERQFASNVISPDFCERVVDELVEFDLEKVGSAAWLRQHAILSKLNLQAHQCVLSKADNFVLENLVTYDKIKLLVHELLVCEVWSKRVFPEIVGKIAKKRTSPLKAYFSLYHQAILINLLEVVLYHDYVAEAAGDSVVDLVDFCARQMTYLNSMKRPSLDDDRADGFGHNSSLTDQANDIAFRVAVSSVGVLRYLAEHVTKLPLSVMHRLLDTHDVCVATVPLIENPPWTRRRRRRKRVKRRETAASTKKDDDDDDGKPSYEIVWEKYGDRGRWDVVEPENLLTLTKHEAQVWLILYNLLCEGKCRKAYAFSTHRKNSILRVRKYMNEVLLDQLPILKHVQRYFDELTIMEVPSNVASSASSRFVLEQVASVRETILRGKNFTDIAARALETTFCGKSSDADDAALKEIAEIYGSDAALSVFAPGAGDDEGKENEATKETEAKKTDLVGAILSIDDDAASKRTEHQYVLRSKTKAKEVKTSQGVFLRYHMQLLKSAPPLDPSTVVRSIVAIDASGAHVSVFDDDDDEGVAMDLPTRTLPPPIPSEHEAMVPVDTALPAVRWIKVGDLSKGAVAQLKLKRRNEVLPRYAKHGCCYGLSDIFVSMSPTLPCESSDVDAPVKDGIVNISID